MSSLPDASAAFGFGIEPLADQDPGRPLEVVARDGSARGMLARQLGVAFWVATGWIGLVVILAVLASVLPLSNPDVGNFSALSLGPSGAHWFGTDELGRDLLSRVIFGSRVSLIVGIGSAFVGTVVGGFLGLVAGYLRGAGEGVIMVVMDAIVSFPSLVMLIVLTTFLGKNEVDVTAAIALVSVPVFARLTRANTLSVAKRPFVLAARSAGASNFRVMMREIVPNVLPSILPISLVVVAVAIVAEGSLSFLGLSIPPPTPTWGGIIASGQDKLGSAPQIVFAPAGVMFLTVFAFSVAGERLRRIGQLSSGGI